MSSYNVNDSIDDLRQKGNYEFQQGNLDHALAFYTAAIEQAQSESASSKNNEDDTAAAAAAAAALIVNLCNRSACSFQMEDYDLAKQDAALAWNTSKESNVKAAYRLGKTLIALEEHKAAIDVMKVALTIITLQPKEEQSLQDLLKQAQTKALQPKNAAPETTIKGAERDVSIREFQKLEVSLGVGNFSEIIVCQHKVTKETFALKILEKKTAADLAKRQHPNVYNEIAMEARILLERLPPHPNIVTMYHAFQDYNSLYYLMDLHNVNPDLWSQIRYNGRMVGCHASQIQRWMLQLIDALEHLHANGIVHRDLKPENILLNEKNHIVVIDLGTAKDLVMTDLNGPEFVGTPDFMSPEAVTGFSGMAKDAKEEGATHCADLWALGAVAYILHTGSTPFWSPSQYLAFLRIKRGLLPRDAWGIADPATWDFITRLMQVEPKKRLGADCYQVAKRKVVVSKGYDVLRNHEYFAGVNKADKTTILPSLQDLCIRACAELAKNDSLDLDICDQHPPGDGSSHDFTRLSQQQRHLVWHVLDKCRVFSFGDETRVFQRFFEKDVDFLRAKVRQDSRDFLGLTQMNDDEYKPQSARGSADPYAKKDELESTKIVFLSNPMLLLPQQQQEISPEQEKRFLKGWKNSIAEINKKRPKAVVVCGQHISPKYWKFLARIGDSIPVLWNDGSAYYTFWLNGFQGIVLQSSQFQDENGLQMKWLRELMEQSRMAKPQLFCFCDCDPRDLPALVLKRLARGRVLALMGLSKTTGEMIDYKLTYEPNETVDDDTSVKSNDSVEDEQDGFTMRVLGTSENGIRWLTVDEKEKWSTSFEAVEVPSE
jgi:serine/threonine protein kinase